ncbi:DAK2 domain-containing protein [Skermania sp. ID1734]|uniref:DAK2 domain-containing protein n=1 Tax=Skermania sp. ID1734 TaxID=2597516 RepID=UPI00117D2E70|nr:DAK2 domain-containing protein [Skermania sp. ID1734]TSE01046.1 DAK2 domain-containing protein [Skermania sp. ID1734]
MTLEGWEQVLEVLDALDGDALRRWGNASIDGLVQRCEEINRLNVFPIRDSDTGTNLLFTMRAAVDAVTRDCRGEDRPTAHQVARAMARGATTGARGNSGIILSQVLRGIAECVGDGPLTALTLPEALETAASLVRGAVSEPVEGTMVTVLDCAAGGARDWISGELDPPSVRLADVVAAAAAAGADALRRTTEQLPALRDAGVVDAGGLGVVVLLDALVYVTTGQAPEREQFIGGRADQLPDLGPDHTWSELAEHEVMYLVSGTDAARMGRLRRRLDELGDSVVVVDDAAGTWSVHVHSSDAGAAVEAGMAAGTVRQIRIGCFAAVNSGSLRGPAHRGILAVVTGAGAADLFEAEGARVVRSDTAISAAQLLNAIEQLPFREVLVLPNGALPAQELVAVGVAARDANRDVLLLPTSSVVQGLAALAVHDDQRIAVDDAFAMSEAAASTRWGSLRVAPERALTLVGTCAAGDGLGLIGHEVVVIEPDVRAAGTALLDRVLGLGGEMVTMLRGADATDELVQTLTEHVDAHHPGVEVLVYDGGQRDDLIQLGVE